MTHFIGSKSLFNIIVCNLEVLVRFKGCFEKFAAEYLVWR